MFLKMFGVAKAEEASARGDFHPVCFVHFRMGLGTLYLSRTTAQLFSFRLDPGQYWPHKNARNNSKCCHIPDSHFVCGVCRSNDIFVGPAEEDSAGSATDCGVRK